MRPDGSTASVLADNKWVFRSFRVQTLYTGVSDQLAGGGGEESRDGDDFRGALRGDWARRDGPTGASLAALKGFSDDFGPGITTALNGSADQPAIPAAFAVASSDSALSGIAAPLVPVADPETDPAFSDPPAVAAAAARDTLFTDPGNDGWGERLGEDLARAISP